MAIIINERQYKKLKEIFSSLNEESVNISAQAKSNSLADFASAAGNSDTRADIQKAGNVASDVSLTVSGPNADDSQPQQQINVGQGDSIQNAINTQANDTLIRNGGSVKITGDGIGESVKVSKKEIQEFRLAAMRKNGKRFKKKELTEEFLKAKRDEKFEN